MYFFPRNPLQYYKVQSANIFFCRVSDQNVSTERFCPDFRTLLTPPPRPPPVGGGAYFFLGPFLRGGGGLIEMGCLLQTGGLFQIVYQLGTYK